jgi:bifunctional enzyme CysN/CysC
VSLVALISPEAEGRAYARELHGKAGVPFVEVYMDTPLAVCEQRDPKGLYARARTGALHGMTGVDAPYEPPDAPEVVLRSSASTVDDEVERVLNALARAEEALAVAVP